MKVYVVVEAQGKILSRAKAYRTMEEAEAVEQEWMSKTNMQENDVRVFECELADAVEPTNTMSLVFAPEVEAEIKEEAVEEFLRNEPICQFCHHPDYACKCGS